VRKVKWSALLSGVILLCVSAGQARATIWCGHGPGTVLNHPCAASDRPRDPALSEALAKYGTQWSNLTGVWKVSPASSAAGGGAEIQVSADPRWAACVRNQIPESVDDIPVLVVPGEVPKVIISNGYFGYLHRPPSRKSNSNLDSEKTYSELVRQSGPRWLALPGVIGIEPAGCDCDSCNFKGIEISVQRQFMSALLKQIPPSVKGVPVNLLPSD